MHEIRFEVKVTIDDEGMPTGTVIGCDSPTDASFDVLMAAAEHFMTVVALNSDAGFEKALELLCEGARSNKVHSFKGSRAQ